VSRAVTNSASLNPPNPHVTRLVRSPGEGATGYRERVAPGPPSLQERVAPGNSSLLSNMNDYIDGEDSTGSS
jgi:hypothetical protein